MENERRTPKKRYRFTRQFENSYAVLPDEITNLFEKKLDIFLNNIFHPSLRTKKIKGLKRKIIWEASLTMDYRLTFEVDQNGDILFRNIGKHHIIDKGHF